LPACLGAQVHTHAEADRWRNSEASEVGRKLRLTKAVDCGEVGTLLHVRLFSGMARQTNGESVKLFREEWVSVPYQLCCAAPPNMDDRFLECGPKPIEEAFAIGARLLYLKSPYYGLPCRVAAHRSADSKLKVELEISPKWSPHDELFGKKVVERTAEFERYYSSSQLARDLGITPCARRPLPAARLVSVLVRIGWTRERRPRSSADGADRLGCSFVLSRLTSSLYVDFRPPKKEGEEEESGRDGRPPRVPAHAPLVAQTCRLPLALGGTH
jgi:hypothetical protein